MLNPASQITSLPTNYLTPTSQPTVNKHHSTETALLYIHDHLINAIGSQLLCLCLLDLSAAFDTIDHSILLTRLSSWFGIHGSVLSWLKSHLSSRSFRVRCNNTFSSYTSSCGVPQSSILGPLLFIVYITLFSTLISPFPFTITLCRRHPTVLLILPTQFRLKYHPPAKCPSANLLLYDCQSPNFQSIQD